MLFPLLAPRGAHATSLEPSAPSCANSATSGDTGCPARRQAEDAHLSAAAPTATHASQPRLVTTRSLLCFRDDPRQPNPQDRHDSFKRLDAGVLLSSFEESVEYTVGIAVLGDLAKRDV